MEIVIIFTIFNLKFWSILESSPYMHSFLEPDRYGYLGADADTDIREREKIWYRYMYIGRYMFILPHYQTFNLQPNI